MATSRVEVGPSAAVSRTAGAAAAEGGLRVLVVASMLPVGGSYTGIFIAEQVRSLRAARIHVDVLSLDVGKTRLNYLLSFPRLFRAIRAGGFGLIHTHHTYSLLLIDLAKRLARSRVPVVLTSHEGEALHAGDRPWLSTQRLARSLFLKRLAARRADFVVFVSDALARAVSATDRYAVIPCGVDLEVFKPLDPRRCRQQLGISPDDTVIFFPADPQARGKRFALAQAAYEIVRERVPRAVLLTAGNIPYESMPVYYGAADVVLQASFYEASPTVVKESLACEVPLVSTDSGDTREIVEGAASCFVCANDPRELAGRILDCLGHRAVNGRQRLLAKGLSLPQVAERIIGIYGRVLGKSEPL